MTFPLGNNLLADHSGKNAQLVSDYINNSMDCITNTLADQKFQESILHTGAKISDIIAKGQSLLLGCLRLGTKDVGNTLCPQKLASLLLALAW